MPSFRPDDDAPILVEFTAPPDMSDRAMAQRSEEAVNSAMNLMRGVAKMVAESMDSLDNRPSQVEVSFGIQLGSDGNAAMVSIGRTAVMSVKLTWQPSMSANSTPEKTEWSEGEEDLEWGRSGRYAERAERRTPSNREPIWEDDYRDAPGYGTYAEKPRWKSRSAGYENWDEVPEYEEEFEEEFEDLDYEDLDYEDQEPPPTR
jgi:hypothetical protein